MSEEIKQHEEKLPVPRVEIEASPALRMQPWNLNRAPAPVFVRLYDHISVGRGAYYLVPADVDEYYQDAATGALHIKLTVSRNQFLDAERYTDQPSRKD